MNNLGKKIRLARQQAGLTQAKLGEAIGVSGVTIAYLESERRRVTMEYLKKISEATNTPLRSFVEDSPRAGMEELMERVSSLEESIKSKSKEAEAQHLQKDILLSAFEASSEAMLILDHEFSLLYGNGACKSLLCEPDVAVVPDGIFSFQSPFDRVELGLCHERLDKESQFAGKLHLLCTIRGPVPMMITGVKFLPKHGGEVLYFVRIREYVIRQNNEGIYKSMLEAKGIATYQTDEKGVFTEVNSVYAAMHGYTKEELRGMHYHHLIDERELGRLGEFGIMMKKQGWAAGTLIGKQKDGSRLKLSFHTYAGGKGGHIGYIIAQIPYSESPKEDSPVLETHTDNKLYQQ